MRRTCTFALALAAGCDAADPAGVDACGGDAAHLVGTATLSGADADAQAAELCADWQRVDEVVVRGTSWTDLGPLDCLCAIGSLTLEDNAALETTEPVRVEAGELAGVRVVGSPLLYDLAAFEAVTGVGTVHLETLGLDALRGLGGLGRVDTLRILHLPSLAGFDELAAEVQVGSLGVEDAPALGAVGEWGAPRSLGALTLAGTGIVSLEGLADADALTTLALVSNPDLADLTGFPRATAAPVALSIGDSPALRSLAGLRGIGELDTLGLADLAEDASLAGLEQLAMVGGVHLAGFPALESLAGLDGLRYLTATGLHVEVQPGGPPLHDLEALHQLQGIVGGITITGPVTASACLGLWEALRDRMDSNDFQCGDFEPE